MTDIIFKDKLFKANVLRFLGLSQDELTETDIRKIRSLCITDSRKHTHITPWSSENSTFELDTPSFCFSTIESENEDWIQDLAHFKNLTTLHIYSKTRHLSSLKNLSKLTELYIINSTATDWSFLEETKRLRFLYLDKCPNLDLSALPQLCETQNEDDRTGKNNLVHLHIINCNLENADMLVNCIYVNDLDLSYNPITDIKALSKLQRLYYLTICWTPLSDISALSSLKMLNSLNLRHNHITNIKVIPILHEKNLSKLFLIDNPIFDYSCLKSVHLEQSDVTYRGEKTQ